MRSTNRWIVCIDSGSITETPRQIRWLLTPRLARQITRFNELPSCSSKFRFVEEVRGRYGCSPEEPLVIEVHLKQNEEYDLDFAWELRILGLFRMMLQKEKLMWNLSTLGGALSAMGDYFDSFADKAQQVSFEQLKIAHELGDPVMSSRCRLYVAHALAQKGCFRESMYIIRREYDVGKKLKSELLTNCAKGFWSKVCFLKKAEEKQLNVVKTC
ncbi:hypothetical protein L596_018871 [Steinernema carpocapsae]|uniref:Uncharacterized protein n=1 Tax=Steinernema carpocapsae TaxID=34508 RepID=A0A4U5N736_STECR|nr:hypothetical protein L596_018871 [Steinernema carpocapsae]